MKKSLIALGLAGAATLAGTQSASADCVFSRVTNTGADVSCAPVAGAVSYRFAMLSYAYGECPLTTVTAPSATLTGLVGGLAYNNNDAAIRMWPLDAAGNLIAGASPNVPQLITLPQTPSRVRLVANTNGTLTLSWTGNTPYYQFPALSGGSCTAYTTNTGLSYKVFNASTGAQVANTTSTSLNLTMRTGVNSYYVVATNFSGDSARSTTASYTSTIIK